MLQCECGFTCGTVNGYASHLARFSGDELKLHQLVPNSTSALTAGMGSAAQQRPVTRSWARQHSSTQPSPSTYSIRYSPGPPSDEDSDEESAARTRVRRAASATPASSMTGRRAAPAREGAPETRARIQPPPPLQMDHASLGNTGRSPLQNRSGNTYRGDPVILCSSSPEPSRPSQWVQSTADALRTAGMPEPLPVSASLPTPSCSVGDDEDKEEGMDTDDTASWSSGGGTADIATVRTEETGSESTMRSAAISLGGQLRQSLDLRSIRTVASNIIGLLDLSDQSTPRLRHVSISSAQDTFLWRDGMSSLRVFGIGLYLLICIQHLVSGAIVLLPTTLLSLSGIGFLVWNVVRNYCICGRAHGRVVEREMQAQKSVTDAMMKVAVAIIPRIGAAAGLAIRCLSGRELGAYYLEWGGSVHPLPGWRAADRRAGDSDDVDVGGSILSALGVSAMPARPGPSGGGGCPAAGGASFSALARRALGCNPFWNSHWRHGGRRAAAEPLYNSGHKCRRSLVEPHANEPSG
eukprot:CAMPEP_0117653884 /NCGR_PEP_ID=MMETSP0804-20121206/3438_1 /TAXON_ID=1074897 /ORGANISM="Tetraselmis astigmatica, Strain CCMP880" /LENGTH=522 /DNA_ID=CAMNT_0005460107 /DNA_START=221 /DNA_END=1785 /DNA_ORIENTATION=+